MAQDDFKSEYLEEIKRKIIFSIEEFHPSTAPPPSHQGYSETDLKKAWDAFHMRGFPHNTDSYGNETFEQFLIALKNKNIMALARTAPRCPDCGEITAEAVYKKQPSTDINHLVVGDNFLYWKDIPHQCKKRHYGYSGEEGKLSFEQILTRLQSVDYPAWGHDVVMLWYANDQWHAGLRNYKTYLIQENPSVFSSAYPYPALASLYNFCVEQGHLKTKKRVPSISIPEITESLSEITPESEKIIDDHFNNLKSEPLPPLEAGKEVEGLPVNREGWIRVEDGLPEVEGSYLAWVTKHNFLGPQQGAFVAYYGLGNDEDATEMFWAYRMELIEVTHWMPLPPNPTNG